MTATRAPLVVGLTWLLAMTAGMLSGCALFDDAPTPAEVRAQANAMRVEVNAAADAITAAGGYVPIACAYRGEQSQECATLRAAYDAARSSVVAAHAAIDAYDSAGVGLAAADQAARELREVAEVFARDVRALVEAAYGTARADRASGGVDDPRSPR